MIGIRHRSAAIVGELLASYGAAARERATDRAAALLNTASPSLKAGGDFCLRSLGPPLALGLTLAWYEHPLAGVAGVATVLGARRWARRRGHEARRESLDRDLPALLTSVASSVKAGLDPLSALIEAREYFAKQSPLAMELDALRKGLSSGDDEVSIVQRFLAGYENADAELFKRCLLLSRRHGASLAAPLHRITRVVRARHSFRRKVRAALAMHRMSAVGIALCALVVGAIQGAMNMKGVRIAIEHPTGRALLIAGGALMVLGIGWMLSMGRGVGR